MSSKKISKNNFLFFAIAIALLFVSSSSNAIVLDFDGGGEIIFDGRYDGGGINFTYKGARISILCSLNFWGSGGYLDTGYLATHPSGCGQEEIRNPSFLGSHLPELDDLPADRALIYIDYNGIPFSLESIVGVHGHSYGDVISPNPTGSITIASSKGDFTGFSSNTQEVIRLNDPMFRGIKWAMFDIQYYGYNTTGIDNIELRIPMPEPYTLVLIIIGLVGVAVTARRTGSARPLNV